MGTNYDGISYTSIGWAERVFKLPQLKEKIKSVFTGYKGRILSTLQSISTGGRTSRIVFQDDDMIRMVEKQQKRSE